jgi:tRNA-Thr(GGU) m(6)t(6)A37 methyltransferase TsaA
MIAAWSGENQAQLEMSNDMTEREFTFEAIGFIRSNLINLEDAPHQGHEGAPDVWLEFTPSVAGGLKGMAVGDEIIVLTWLHRSSRDVLQVHPRGNPETPLTGVFATRSPDRPNPIGHHQVTVLEMDGQRLRIGPIEAINGTPVLDVKPVI